jgi:hypothetical protein
MRQVGNDSRRWTIEPEETQLEIPLLLTGRTRVLNSPMIYGWNPYMLTWPELNTLIDIAGG